MCHSHRSQTASRLQRQWRGNSDETIRLLLCKWRTAKPQADAEAKAKEQTVLAHHAAIADARRNSETLQRLTSTPRLKGRISVELISSHPTAQRTFAAPMPVTMRPLARPLELNIEPQSTDDIIEVPSSHHSRASKQPRSDSAASLGLVAKIPRISSQTVDPFLGDPEEDLRNLLSQYSRERSGERPLYSGLSSRSLSLAGRGRSSRTESHRGCSPSSLADNSQLFPLADQTFFDDDLLVSPEPYRRNRFCSSHVFLANKMLADPEHNDSADFLAIGDSMFHHIAFDLGQAGKVVPYSGQRIAEVYRYYSSHLLAFP